LQPNKACNERERGEPLSHLNAFLDTLEAMPDVLVYLLLGLSAFVENVFPPIPGDTITAFGAFLVGAQRLHFFGVFLSTTLGSVSGFMFLFWVGDLLGRRYFIERDFRFFKARDILRAEAWFRRYGYVVILLNRFFPGVRSVISIAGGISKLNRSRVFFMALISCAVWNLIWIYFGYTLGSKWEVVQEKMAAFMMRYYALLLCGLGAAIFLILLRKWVKRQNKEP
jgi:membrane protein DedA with SNARE-associated domain